MTCHKMIAGPGAQRSAVGRAASVPPPIQSRPRLRRRPTRWSNLALRLTLWAGAVLSFYFLAGVLAAKLGSLLIGYIGAGLAALLALTVLAPASSGKTARRR